jgi:hypothetical protein
MYGIYLYIMTIIAVLGTLAVFVIISDCKRQKKIDEELTKNKF